MNKFVRDLICLLLQIKITKCIDIIFFFTSIWIHGKHQKKQTDSSRKKIINPLD